MALFHFVYLKDEEGIRRIDAAFLSSPHARDPELVASWKAYTCFYRLIFGKGGDLKLLQNLSLEFPKNAQVHLFYARALSKFDKHFEAASEYEAAAFTTSTMDEKANFLGEAAAAFAKGERADLAAATITKARQANATGEITEAQLLTAMLTYEEQTKNKEVQIAISERLVDITPGDYRTRFALAYMHSEIGNDDLALHHYLKIPANERNGITWNNLGASFQQFRLHVKSVHAYRKSDELDETLAMANLGYKMLSVGFMAEARAFCEKALSIKGAHKNVGLLLVKLNDATADEDKILEELLDKSRSKTDFYREFGRAVGAIEPVQIGGSWAGPQCLMTIVIAFGSIQISGDYEREENPFGLSIGMLSSSRKVRQRIEYRGRLVGRAIFATVTRTDDGEASAATSLLGSAGAKTLMFVSNDEEKISVIENPSSPNPRFFLLTRPKGTSAIASPQ